MPVSKRHGRIDLFLPVIDMHTDFVVVRVMAMAVFEPSTPILEARASTMGIVFM